MTERIYYVSIDSVVAVSGVEDEETATIHGAEQLAEYLDRYLHGDEDAIVFQVEWEEA